MDQHEEEQLDEIHTEVKGSHAQLGAIAERTRSIQDSLQDIDDKVDKNRRDINDLQSNVKRNTTIINAVTVGLSGVVLWISDKLTRINPLA
jgi:peptidoglycan hydrolase CwlO-like protein